MNPTAQSFDRLERAITIIARHANYRGKQEAIAQCLADIEGRWDRGVLDIPQRFRLMSILLQGKLPRPARSSAGAC
jgi:hypothetical protein